jgi:serine/threonine protein kinase
MVPTFLTGYQGKKNLFRRSTLGDTSPSNEFIDKDTEIPIFRFREIAAATNNFSESSILGQGGFGYVYKARMLCTYKRITNGICNPSDSVGLHFFQRTLEDGSEIAVKRLCAGSVQGVVEFKNEVVLIAKMQHRNLVKLQGCCIHKDEKLLIYEYLPNRSLDAFIFSKFLLLP